jgi:glycosyltransferase involved in cell wall biosynthesis
VTAAQHDTPTKLGYALVTPARDEEENLRRLAESVTTQLRVPDAWVIVDNGSVDNTVEVAKELEERHEWIHLLTVPPLPAYYRGGPEVSAFMDGVAALDRPSDVFVKLDADVSFAPDFFDLLISEFEHDPSLGIASGICLELESGVWTPRHSTRSHPRGATRAYRRDCWSLVAPLEPHPAWDTIDELKALIGGWRIATFDQLPFFHHRRMGVRDGRWGTWEKHGSLAHYIGYRPTYVLARAAFRSLDDPAALALLWGYAKAVLRREPQYHDALVRKRLRDDQRLRHLPDRLREARGRAVGPSARVRAAHVEEHSTERKL